MKKKNLCNLFVETGACSWGVNCKYEKKEKNVEKEKIYECFFFLLLFRYSHDTTKRAPK
jgi:hypothetical protein